MVWESKDQVQSCTPGIDVPQLAVSSTPEEWAHMGKSLFHHQRYNQAMHCFDRAGMIREVAVAKAYSLREQARTISITNVPAQEVQRKAAYTDSAHAFLQCAAAAKNTNERRTYYTISGDCFVKCDAYRRAADAYLAGEIFTDAVMCYRKAGDFQEAVKVIKRHRHDHRMDPKVASSVMDVARLHCFRDPAIRLVAQYFWDKGSNANKTREEEILQQAKDLFENNLGLAETFLSEYGFESACATLILYRGEPEKAAKLHLNGGRLKKGTQILMENMATEACAKFAAQSTVDALWKSLSFGVEVGNVADKNALNRWLEVASELDGNILSQRDDAGEVRAKFMRSPWVVELDHNTARLRCSKRLPQEIQNNS